MILDVLAQGARERVAKKRAERSLPSVRREAELLAKSRLSYSFESALRGPGIAVIAEVKKASPSKGMIAPNGEFPYLDIAREYEKSGADAISVLTEPEHFLGRDAYLEQIAAAVQLPVLRKDFTVDEYQIFEAKTLGASAVLLICAITEAERLKAYLAAADSVGLAALVEAHSEAEIETAIAAGARIIGVNNRDLKDFSVNTGNAAALRKNVPADILFVAESGITSGADTRLLLDAGVDAVLVGEAVMLAQDRAAFIAELKRGE
ncbi:MAG: indole-3-glycerol phosphate synthase TrpC [Oscillospiraceae bacterium]|jgi:indole-3-glycerol phosphate synthase|nr:indole-3-glycerol phosphate synthase TrpC [Oscillospiraceae bacterium]